MTTKDDGKSTPFSIALQLLGASAGLLALVTFVGGALLWIRFDALHLAADQAVARLPRELLVIVGAHALAVPVICGLVAAIAFTLVEPLDRRGRIRGWRFYGMLAAVAVAGLAAILWKSSEFTWLSWAAMLVLAAVGIGAILAVARQQTRARYVGWAAFAAVTLCGAGLSVARTAEHPLMEPVALLLADGERGMSGFYVGETGDRLFVAPVPGTGDPGDPFADAPLDRVLSISRDKITRLAIREPIDIGADGAGREQAKTLLIELQQSTTPQGKPRPEKITTVAPVVAFAPLVHLHSRERWLPTAAGSFILDSNLIWAHPGRCPDDTIAEGADIEVERLGGVNTYTHSPVRRDCGHDPKRSYRATDHTRPGDEKRAAGLPLDEGFVLKLRQNPAERKGKIDKAAAQDVLRNVPAYFEVDDELVEGEKNKRIKHMRITYWFFYAFSQPPPVRVSKPISHEGDWERISVLVRPRERTNEYIPVSVRYHFHNDRRDFPWHAVRRVASGGPEPPTHPVVYSAIGSHASYPRDGRYPQDFDLAGRQPFRINDDAMACPDCPQWRTWASLADARQAPWYGFGGAWGKVGRIAGTSGPLGPSPFKSGRETRVDKPTAEEPSVPRENPETDGL